MQLRVTTLAENTATKMGALAEHGLSMLVEVDDLCLLLDAGQTDTVVHNFFNNVGTVTEWEL